MLLFTRAKADATEADTEVRREQRRLAAETAGAIILPEPIADPIEPVNRGLWVVNQGLLKGAIQPSGKVYRAIVPSDVRRGFRNAGRNLHYPRNLVNNLLQQKWIGARDETYRFLLNSVGGIGGFFDVATPSGIGASEADFGQTFGKWGWQPQVYLMLPITGPSNERDALGGLADRLVNPISYFSPYSYIPLGITYNNLTETVDEYIRVAKADYDPYYVLRYAWILKREGRPVDLTVDGPSDAASLETLQSVFFKMRDPKFPERGDKRSVGIAATGQELPYTVWVQRKKAPVVFLVPGFGSHRLSGGSMALAEVLYDAGFSVLTVSSAFNYEFMQRAATTPLPGYTPVDAHDLHVALTEIDKDLHAKFGERIGTRALLGYSMGGFHTLYLAGTEGRTDGLVKFDRYVAVNPPVRVDHAISTLDDHFNAALAWPAAERTAKIEDTFAKVAALSSRLSTLNSDSKIPLNATESKFLVGLAFRISLRDVIYLSQTKTNMGILQKPIKQWRREPVYREIFQYSFTDYLQEFVTPYYETRGINLSDETVLRNAVDLHQMDERLNGNKKVRIVVNANDPVLGEKSLAWLQQTFAGQVMTFPRGGHLGNLNQTVVQREIVRALSDLLPAKNY